MLRLITTFSLLITGSGAYATQLDDTLCKELGKERPELCRGRTQPAPKAPEKKSETPTQQEVPSGPGWTLIVGEKKKDIQNYLVQAATNMNYRGCRLNGKNLHNSQGTWVSLQFALGRASATVELNKNSVRPLFHIFGNYGEEYYDKAAGATIQDKYESFVSTSTDRTQIENISVIHYSESQVNYYVGPHDDPQVVKTKPRTIKFEINCDAQ